MGLKRLCNPLEALISRRQDVSRRPHIGRRLGNKYAGHRSKTSSHADFFAAERLAHYPALIRSPDFRSNLLTNPRYIEIAQRMSPSAARLGNLLPTMIITYPIQLPYIAGSEQRVVPDSISNRSEILSGSYLLGKNRFWHGGIHIHPLGKDTPIVAIADGDLIAYRYDEIDETDEYFKKTSCSRSFVLLKHEAELGQTGLGAAKLSFYSLYMHLRSWGDVC